MRRQLLGDAESLLLWLATAHSINFGLQLTENNPTKYLSGLGFYTECCLADDIRHKATEIVMHANGFKAPIPKVFYKNIVEDCEKN